MKKSLKELINMFFGTNNKTRFKRLLILIGVLTVVVMLTMNLRYDENGWGWGPAVDINANINVGEEGPAYPGGGPVK